MIKPIDAVTPIKEVKTMVPVVFHHSAGGVDHVYNFKNPHVVEHVAGPGARIYHVAPTPVKHHVEAPHHV